MTQKKSGPPPIVYILIFLLLAAGGYWWFFMRRSRAPQTATNPAQTATNAPNAQTAAPNAAPATATFSPPTSVPSGTTVQIAGSTSMVAINQALKTQFESQFPGTTVTAQAEGTSRGIEALLAGNADVAAASRPLTPEEQNRGLATIPVAADAIALVVGVENPFGQGLTRSQVVGIFTGQITNWSDIGGPNQTIQVINRPPVSGTHQAFKELVLGGSEFGNTPNITTMQRDATTPMLRALGDSGIGYATYDQIANQKTVRIVAVDGLTPQAANYPYKRTLYYVYQTPPSPAVEAFLGFVNSPQGQQAIASTNR